jgi:tRNA pseudouridine(38-40) synthase
MASSSSSPSAGDEQEQDRRMILAAANQVRRSHDDFFEDRDWDSMCTFWKWCLNAQDSLPAFVHGHQDEEAKGTEDSFGVTQFKMTQDSWVKQGLPLFEKHRYPDRVNFALRIGYSGNSYSGYQKQKAGIGIHTVEDDLLDALHGQKTNAAGRTDKDVSAVSQVINFHTREKVTPEDIMSRAKQSDAVKSGNITIFECYNMPRRFHALFSATWRRYIFLVPLNSQPSGKFDIDTDFVGLCLRKLENKSLHCNCFAAKETVEKDLCQIYRSDAIVVDVNSSNVFEKKVPAICIELVGSRFLRNMVRVIVSTVVRESVRSPESDRNENILLDCCESGDRQMAAFPLNGKGLALAGVGYSTNPPAAVPPGTKNSRQFVKDSCASASASEIQESSNKLSHRNLRLKRKAKLETTTEEVEKKTKCE